MNIAALVVACIALVLAYVAWSRFQAVARELRQAQADLQQARAEWVQARAELHGRLDDLCREARRHAGDLKFTPAMTIAEALKVHPGVARVLADFQLGGCSNCEVSDVDTLEGACRSYGIDQEGLMRALGALLNAPASPEADKPIKIGSMRVDP